MTESGFLKRLTHTAALVAAGLVLSGCPEDAIDINEPASEPSFNFSVGGVFTAPTGTFAVERLTLADFDATLPDAFGRSVTGNSPFYSAGGAVFGAGWNFTGFDRNATTDPRLPTLVDDDATIIGGDGFVIGDSNESGFVAGHNPFIAGLIVDLDPNQTYVVAFFRYGLDVNGDLDAEQAALGNVVDAPDQLVPVGGTPQGDPTVAIESFPTFVPMQSGANPLILGNFQTDVDGAGFFDVVVDGPGILYADASGDPPPAAFDSSLVARNDDSSTSLPRYNYLVILQGPAVDAADAADNAPAMRIQIGQDFDAASGQPINNGYAPFPIPLSVPQLVAAPGGAGRPDSIAATFNDLEALTDGARYEAWLANPQTGSMVPAVGTYNRIRIVVTRDPDTGEVISTSDEIVETVSNTNSFAGGDEEDGFRHQLVLSDATLDAGDTVGLHNYMMLTIAETPGGASPSESRPFWFQFTDQAGTPDNFFDDAFFMSGTTQFGNFDAADPLASLPFGGEGGGRGRFRENVLSVDLELLSRPPVGYRYVAWLAREDGSLIRLPEVTGPPPERTSLTNADIESIPGLTTGTGILDANVRVVGDEAGIDFANFASFLLSLEPKAGDPELGTIPTHAGQVPDRVRSPPGGGG